MTEPVPRITTGDTVGRGLDASRLELEELAVVIDRVAVGQLAEHVQALVHPAAAGGRVDSGVADLAPVFAGHPDAERQPTRRQLADRGKLAGCQQRMAQCEQVGASVVELGPAIAVRPS